VNAGPDGTPWPENSTKQPPAGGYKTWKPKQYEWYELNYRTGQMLSVKSLSGGTTVEKKGVTLCYGRNQPASGGGFPTGLCSDQDQKRTDLQKAASAHIGDKNGKKRPF